MNAVLALMAEGGVSYVWIGGKDIYNNDTYYFIGSGKQVPQAMWKGAPDHYKGDCVFIEGDKLKLEECDIPGTSAYLCEAFL